MQKNQKEKVKYGRMSPAAHALVKEKADREGRKFPKMLDILLGL